MHGDVRAALEAILDAADSQAERIDAAKTSFACVEKVTSLLQPHLAGGGGFRQVEICQPYIAKGAKEAAAFLIAPRDQTHLPGAGGGQLKLAAGDAFVGVCRLDNE